MTADREAVDLDALTARAEALLAVADRATNLVDFPDAVEATHVVTRDAPSLVRALLAEVRRLRAPAPDIAAVEAAIDSAIAINRAQAASSHAHPGDSKAGLFDRAKADAVEARDAAVTLIRALSRAPAAVSVPADLAGLLRRMERADACANDRGASNGAIDSARRDFWDVALEVIAWTRANLAPPAPAEES